MAAKKLCDHYTICAVQIVDSEGWWLIWSSYAFKEASNSQYALLVCHSLVIPKSTEQNA